MKPLAFRTTFGFLPSSVALTGSPDGERKAGGRVNWCILASMVIFLGGISSLAAINLGLAALLPAAGGTLFLLAWLAVAYLDWERQRRLTIQTIRNPIQDQAPLGYVSEYRLTRDALLQGVWGYRPKVKFS